MQHTVTLDTFFKQAQKVAGTISTTFPEPEDGYALFGVPRGGIMAATAVLSHLLKEGYSAHLVQDCGNADIIIDDIYDSGRTADRYFAYNRVPFLTLFDKRNKLWKDKWLVMPYDMTDQGTEASAEDIIVRLLQYIGEDPKRGGLIETPKRVLKAWKERCSGYSIDPKSLLKTFEDGAEGAKELVIVHGIEVVSCCEHHMADIRGTASVGYIPNGKIVGLSKLARVVDAYARRLQVQERLTAAIADCIWDGLDPIGVGVLIRASHACMSNRGVKLHGSVTTTSAMRGALLDEPSARAEFLQLCEMAEKS